MNAFTNRLAGELSPYLLQHAHNPVDWYPWGQEALQKAINENKPILVSIGYAACHWCHVMEKESFEDEDTAALMNEHFICIKIDREERPDLDHIYMDALQAMTGSGGWPLNVFLTPEAKPFYGGTYFPPRPAYNRPSWKEVLLGVAQSFREKKHEIEAQADNLTSHLLQSNAFGLTTPGGSGQAASRLFNRENLRQIYENIMKTADRVWGGFGHAPKFPQTFSIQFLLHYYHFTGEAQALQQACLSLDKMIQGGLYDHIGGGFARYSTDREWLAPHFEKMLYDNALLVMVLSEAYQLTRRPLYASAISSTLEFIEREMQSPQGGYYASLDADSEGEEGKFYVWSRQQVEEILGSEAEWFCAFYDITDQGNWEGKNIPRTKQLPEEFARLHQYDLASLQELLDRGRRKLLEARNRRIRPATDHKIILGWNALMNQAYCRAYAALGVEAYRQTAIRNTGFLLNHLQGTGIHYFYHVSTGATTRFPGFLDDYASLTASLLALQEITSDTSYLEKAREIAEFTILHFSEADSPFFYFTHQQQPDLILRKKEIYDGATPSGNAQMAFNLVYLSILLGIPAWKQRALDMICSLENAIIKYPNSFGLWADVVQAITLGIPELVITGENVDKTVQELLSNFIPYKVFQSATQENKRFPLLAGKIILEKPLIFLCWEYSCQTPVNDIPTLIRNLENVHKFTDKPIQ